MLNSHFAYSPCKLLKDETESSFNLCSFHDAAPHLAAGAKDGVTTVGCLNGLLVQIPGSFLLMRD